MLLLYTREEEHMHISNNKGACPEAVAYLHAVILSLESRLFLPERIKHIELCCGLRPPGDFLTPWFPCRGHLSTCLLSP